MRAFFAGLSFLTILPSPVRTESSDLARSLPCFPLIGLVVGALAALLGWGCAWLLPAAPASWLAVLSLAVLTGGLHLDGLADTADGFFSHRPRERVLEIMRDSRIGTMGVLALVFCLGTKVSALAALPPGMRWRTLALMPVCGRVAQLINLRLLPYARPGGLGTAFFGQRDWLPALGGSALALALGLGLLGPRGLLAALGALGFALVWARFSHQRIGGATGDTLGAVSELAEALVALGACLSLNG